jgi:UPF0716 protein FxsA
MLSKDRITVQLLLSWIFDAKNGFEVPLLILIYPFAEFFAWYKFIDTFSFLDALLVVVTGFFLGLLIMMTQGRAALMQAQMSLAEGKMPGNAILHRGMIMFGGLLILVPGLLCKVAGFMLVFPGFRHISVWYFKWALAGKVANGSFRVFMSGGFPGGFQAGGFRDVAPSHDVLDIKAKVTHTPKNED